MPRYREATQRTQARMRHFQARDQQTRLQAPGGGDWTEVEGEYGLCCITGRQCCRSKRTETAVTRTGKSSTPQVHRCQVALQVVSAEH